MPSVASLRFAIIVAIATPTGLVGCDATPTMTPNPAPTVVDSVIPRQPVDTLVEQPPVDTAVVDTAVVVPAMDTIVVPPPVMSARLLVTPARLATWQRMVAEGHPLARLADANCQANRYGDGGLWCAWWFMATRDSVAGRKAVGTWLATTSGVSLNAIREDFVEKAVTYDWLCASGVATPSQCATMRSRLDPWKNVCRTVRMEDGDQAIGCYFGRVAYAYATGDSADVMVAGGLVRTGFDRSTYRNTIGGYFDAMEGGALGESFAYDVGTAMLALIGVEVVKSATGVDHFPEFPVADLARYHIASTTGDLRQWVQHGDEQDPRDQTGRLFKRMTLYLGVQGVTKDPFLHSLIRDLAAKYGWTGNGSAEPWARALLFFDPYAPVASPLFGDWVANGHGMIYSRQPTQTLWLAAFNNTFEDHQYDHLFDAQVYKNGEWALTHPLGYGAEPARVTASNGLSLAGLGAMFNRRMTWTTSGAGWIAIAGVTGGSPYASNYYLPPPSFIRYAGRTSVAGTVGATTVVITRDTVDMDDPRTLPRFDRYRPTTHSSSPHQAWINDANGLPWTIWHAPVRPSVSGNVLTWATAGGQAVRVELLADQPIQTATFDEATLWGAVPHAIRASELGWQTRANTAAPVLWSVVQIGPPLPVTRSGDTITVGGQAWTLTTAGVAGP